MKGVETMKFFAVNEPYYALIKAKDKEDAMNEYIKTIAEEEKEILRNTMKEVSRDYALVCFSKVQTEDNPTKLLELFNNEDFPILIIDEALL